MLVLYPGRIGIWSVDFLVEGKTESPEKNTRSMAKTITETTHIKHRKG